MIRPPEVVATHDFLLIGWILLLLLATPWLALGLGALVVGALGFIGYTPTQIVILLSTGSAIIDGWIAFFAFSFVPALALGLGALAVALFLVLIFVIYFTTVRRTSTGFYEGARAASLFFGALLILISLVSFAAFFGFPFFASAALLILPALFFLMGYGKLGEVIARYGPVAVLSDAAPIEAMSQVPAGAAGPAMPLMAAPAIGMGGVAIPAAPVAAPAMPAAPVVPGMPMPPGSSPYQPVGGAVPRIPLCPTCGRELYYASNYKRWYCLVCESRR